MRSFLQKKLHKKEEQIIQFCIELNVFDTVCVKTIQEKLFQIEKFGIQHEDIGWYKDKKRWVGPEKLRLLSFLIPQFWFKPAAYLHDITFIILTLIKDGKVNNFGWMDLETSNKLFVAVSKAYKPRWIFWDSQITKFYKFMLDETGERFI